MALAHPITLLGNAGAVGTALTATATTLVPADAVGTPDTAIAAITSSTPFGTTNAAEFITLLYTVVNLQTRVNELEAVLQAQGILA